MSRAIIGSPNPKQEFSMNWPARRDGTRKETQSKSKANGSSALRIGTACADASINYCPALHEKVTTV